MPISHVSKLYAVTDANIAALTDDPDGGTATYGTAVDLPGIKSVGLGFEINSVSLRGDNRELDADSTLVAVNITFEHAKLSMDALAIMLGGTAADAGADTTETATFSRLGSDAFSYFRFGAKTPTNGVDTVGGDAHLVIYKCKVTDYSLGLAEEDYQTFSGSARGVFRLADEKLFDLILNETATALPA